MSVGSYEYHVVQNFADGTKVCFVRPIRVTLAPEHSIDEAAHDVSAVRIENVKTFRTTFEMKLFLLEALLLVGSRAFIANAIAGTRRDRPAARRSNRLLDQDCEDDPDLCRHMDDPLDRTAPPTNAPSPTDTPGATQQDSSEQTNTPCVADTNGFYGETAATQVTLEFLYEIQFDSTVIQAVETDTLGVVEDFIGDGLAERLFESQCSDARRAPSPPNLRRRLNTVGYQSLPRDLVLSQGDCTSGQIGGEDDSCAIVLGRGSIFVDQEENAETSGSNAVSYIRLVLESGDLAGVSEGIIGAVFVNGTYTKVESNDDEGKGVGEGDDSGLPAYAIVLIAVAVLAVVAALGFFFMAQRRWGAAGRTPIGMLQLDSIASVDSDESNLDVQ